MCLMVGQSVFQREIARSDRVTVRLVVLQCDDLFKTGNSEVSLESIF